MAWRVGIKICLITLSISSTLPIAHDFVKITQHQSLFSSTQIGGDSIKQKGFEF